MIRVSLLWIILLFILTSCSLETKNEDSNRYEIYIGNFTYLLDKKTGESWTANMNGNAFENTLNATWIKNTRK